MPVLDVEGIETGALGCRYISRTDGMVDHIEPDIQLIAGADIIFQVLLEIEVLDKAFDADIVVAGSDADSIIIFAVDKRSIGEQFAVEDMVPAQRARRIAIAEIETV